MINTKKVLNKINSFFEKVTRNQSKIKVFNKTYDDQGNQLPWKSSTGFGWEKTYDEQGKRLS